MSRNHIEKLVSCEPGAVKTCPKVSVLPGPNQNIVSTSVLVLSIVAAATGTLIDAPPTHSSAAMPRSFALITELHPRYQRGFQFIVLALSRVIDRA
jgi:hypothetical protein